MKKLFSFMIVAIFVFMLFSCAGEENTALIAYNSEFDKYNLEGLNIVIGASEYDVLYKLSDNNQISDETRMHIEKVGNELNASFSYVFDTNVYSMSNRVFVSVMSGMEFIDMIYFSQRYLDGYYQYYIPLDMYEELDLTSKKWQFGESMELCKYYGDIYAVCPTYWQGTLPSYYSALLYNRELINHFAMPDPQEFFETKTWTWAEFENYLQTCHEVDTSKTIYSMNGRTDFLSCMAVYSNNGKICEENADGTIRFTLNDANSLEAISWAADLYIREKGNALKPETGNDFDHDIAPFSNSELTFLLYPSWSGTSQSEGWASMVLDNYGYLPFPLGPKGTEYTATIVISNAVSVPINAKDPSVMGIVINELFDFMDGYDETNVFDYIRKYYFHSDLDFEIYMDTVENAKYSYWMTFTKIRGEGEIFRELAADVFSGNKTITQYMEENIEKYESVVNEWNNKSQN